MKLTAKLVNTFKHEKIGKAVAVEGIAIMEGTYKGLDGKTIYYPFDAIVRSSGRLKGKPILYAHTWKGEEVKYVSAGFISETWLGDKSQFYRGYIYDPNIADKVLRGELYANSIEALVETTQENGEVPKAEEIYYEAIVLTASPACPSCLNYSHEVVTNIKLEGGKKRMSNEPTTGTTEPAVEPIIQEPEIIEPKDETKTPEEILQEIKKMAEEVTEYPMPKTKAWGDMTAKEKYQSCVLFFKNQGYPYPYPKPVKKEKDGKTVWEFPPGFPKDFAQLFLSNEAELLKLREENASLKKKVQDLENAEIGRLVNEIKSVDADFKEEEFLKDVTCLETKRAMLEKYKSNIERLKPKLTLKGVEPTPTQKDRLDKACLETFGLTFQELMKEIGEEVK